MGCRQVCAMRLKVAVHRADTRRMAPRAFRSAGLSRSLALLWTFLLATAAILAVGAFVLSTVVSTNLREQALDDNARHLSLYTSTFLTPVLVHGNRATVTACLPTTASRDGARRGTT